LWCYAVLLRIPVVRTAGVTLARRLRAFLPLRRAEG